MLAVLAQRSEPSSPTRDALAVAVSMSPVPHWLPSPCARKGSSVRRQVPAVRRTRQSSSRSLPSPRIANSATRARTKYSALAAVLPAQPWPNAGPAHTASADRPRRPREFAAAPQNRGPRSRPHRAATQWHVVAGGQRPRRRRRPPYKLKLKLCTHPHSPSRARPSWTV
ncbi:hypothetical protein BD413DRAFT_545363 [Trametes elegans]|nr:hypothetical protein BD413DRAFT_545363 [Trametes elegans]